MRALAEQSGDRTSIVQSLYPAGVTAFHRGDLASAERDLGLALSLYDAEAERRLPQRYGLADPYVGSLNYVAALLWLHGHPDQALRRAEEAVAIARELGQPFSVAYASYGLAWVHQLRDEPEAALAVAESTIEVAIRERFPFWLRQAMLPRAWARTVLAKAWPRGLPPPTRSAPPSPATAPPAPSSCAHPTTPRPPRCAPEPAGSRTASPCAPRRSRAAWPGGEERRDLRVKHPAAEEQLHRLEVPG
jgi:tetratricopeptide (TPR) repeat protein